MKIVSINSLLIGSTGKIMKRISALATEMGNEAVVCVPDSEYNKADIEAKYPIIKFGNILSDYVRYAVVLLTGFHGCSCYFATKKLLFKLKSINPDIIHLHNLHPNYINLRLLFKYIKKNNIRTVWTLHDCWALTGQCPHFTMAKCDKWKTGCHTCSQYRNYPMSYVDMTKIMWKLKKKWFTGIKDMTIVTPSKWLADLVKQSYLRDYPIKIINNGIDLAVFKPTESDFRKRYNIEDKYIVLGVAFGWGKRKGLDVFIELSKRLDDNYQIVLVGTNDDVDKQLPENIISIHRTNNQTELAEIYSASDIYVNPTREDTYPTVNMESVACGTPVITFRTGGSPEILDETCGSVVEYDDIDSMEKEIKRICIDKPYTMEMYNKKAVEFNEKDKYSEYMDLYKTNVSDDGK